MSLSPEFFLNVVWFLAAIGAGVVLLPRMSQAGNRRTLALASLICLFALLFPVVSADDDRAQQELLNDATISQMMVKSLDSVKQTPVCRAKWSVSVAPLAVAAELEAEVGEADHGFVMSAGFFDSPAIHSPPCC